MKNNVTFRSFKKGDYELCCEWWKWWDKSFGGEGIERELLPKNERCYIIEKNNIPVACIFLFLSLDVKRLAWITNLVSNPKYREKDRRALIELLIEKASKEAKKYGVSQLFTVCGDPHMSNIHKNLNWIMIPVEHEAFKYI